MPCSYSFEIKSNKIIYISSKSAKVWYVNNFPTFIIYKDILIWIYFWNPNFSLNFFIAKTLWNLPRKNFCLCKHWRFTSWFYNVHSWMKRLVFTCCLGKQTWRTFAASVEVQALKNVAQGASVLCIAVKIIRQNTGKFINSLVVQVSPPLKVTTSRDQVLSLLWDYQTFRP